MTTLTVESQGGGFVLKAGDWQCPAAIGKNGFASADDKREGDGMTPLGAWPVRQIFYRADRITMPNAMMMQTHPISSEMGWCDDPGQQDYNQLVQLPFDGAHEVMMRDDHAYDVVVTLGYNDAPPVPGRGSAIFFHILHEGKNHTEGCVAISRDDMLNILPMLDRTSVLKVTL